MSWHDLFDDASVRRFVSGGTIEEDSEPGAFFDTTALVENDDEQSEGITIVSSVPTLPHGTNTVLIDSTMLNDGASSLSLHPSSVATSVLTDAESLELSEVLSQTSSLESPEAVDRDSEASLVTEDGVPSSIQQKRLRIEEAAREWFLKSNTPEDWEREKDNLLRILSAVEEDCKDPDRLLAELLDDEEKVWRASAAAAAKTRTDAAVLGFWDMALMGAVLSLATAVLIKVVRGR